MARSGWFNDNGARSFPFLQGSTGRPITGPVTLLNLPMTAIVDAGFISGPESGYTSEHRVWLKRVRRASDVFYFEFASDAPELIANGLTFSRVISSSKYQTEHQESNLVGYSDSLSQSSCREPGWTGYLVTGDLTDLATLLAVDGEITGTVYVEPALVLNLSRSAVNSVNLANADRTRVTAADGCDEPIWPHETGTIFISKQCLTGAIGFSPGYNAIIRQSNTDNSLTFAAGVGAGAGEPCEQVPLFSGEQPAEGSRFFDGSLGCGDVLRSFNGYGGRLFEFLVGVGARVLAVPDENKVTINLDMNGLALCAGGISRVSQSL